MCYLHIFKTSCKNSTLRWRHNERDSVSNHQPHDCLLNGLFRRRSKKTSKLRVTGLCVGNSPGPVNSPHKGPVTRKLFQFDDVIMTCKNVPVNDKVTNGLPTSRPHLFGCSAVFVWRCVSHLFKYWLDTEQMPSHYIRRCETLHRLVYTSLDHNEPIKEITYNYGHGYGHRQLWNVGCEPNISSVCTHGVPWSFARKNLPLWTTSSAERCDSK